MFETECQEKIAHAKSLGFYCTIIWGRWNLIFLGSFERELSQIMGICMEKPKTLYNVRTYISAIEKTMPEGLSWTQRATLDHCIGKDIQVSV